MGLANFSTVQTDARALVGGAGHLRTNLPWVFLGNASSALTQFCLLALFARFSGVEFLGSYALALSVVAVISLLANCELRTLQATDTSQRIPFSTYFRIRCMTGLLSIGVLMAIAAWPGFSAATRMAFFAVAVARCLDGVSDVIYGRLQSRDVMTPIGKSQCAKAVLSCATLATALVVAGRVTWAIWSPAAASAGVLLVYDARNLYRFGAVSGQHLLAGAWRTAARQGWPLLRLGLPLALVNSLVSLHAAIPRMVLTRYRGEAGAGIASALLYAVIAPNLFLMALGQVSVTGLSRGFCLRQRTTFLRNLRRLLTAAVLLGGVTVGVALLCGGPLLRLIYGPRLELYSRELTLFSAASSLGLLSTAVGYGISSARIFAPQLPMMLSVCAVSALFCWLFIPGWGLRGAAWAQLVSSSWQLALNFALLSHFVLRELKEGDDARTDG